MIGFVVLATPSTGPARDRRRPWEIRRRFLWQKFRSSFSLPADLGPGTYHFFNKDQVGALANLSRWAFLLPSRGWSAHNFSDMRKQGLRPFAVGAIGEVVIAASRCFGVWCGENLRLVKKIVDGRYLQSEHRHQLPH